MQGVGLVGFRVLAFGVFRVSGVQGFGAPLRASQK